MKPLARRHLRFDRSLLPSVRPSVLLASVYFIMKSAPNPVPSLHFALISTASMFFVLCSARSLSSTSFCGTNLQHASLCQRECSKTFDETCPPGQSCYKVATCVLLNESSSQLSPSTLSTLSTSTHSNILLSNLDHRQVTASHSTSSPSPTALYPVVHQATPVPFQCGTSFSDAGKCKVECPGGLDGECPDNEKCYADIACVSQSAVPKASQTPSASANPSLAPEKDSGSGLSGLEKFGIIIGTVLAIASIVGGGLLVRSRSRRRAAVLNRGEEHNRELDSF